MIKPYHMLKVNKLMQKMNARVFRFRIGGEWYSFQDEAGSTTPAIVFEEISRGHYELQTRLEPGMVFVDVGAHVGMLAIPLAKRNPGVLFYCIEPDPTNFKNLVHNVRRAGVDNVAVLNIGLWSEPCQMSPVKHDPGNTGGSASLPVASGGLAPGMTWARFRELFNLKMIDVLKMDCEGAEFHILKEPTDLNGVGELLGEIHGTCGDVVGMKRLMETVPKTRLQVIHAEGYTDYWLNGERYAGRNLEAHCAYCGQKLLFWDVPSCPKNLPGFNCVPG